MTSHIARTTSDSLLLADYCRHGDRTARDRVIEQNLPLVRAIARRFSRSPDQVDDLFQVGAIGLIKAVDGFEARRGGDLRAYAVPTIVGELKRSVGAATWPVRIPRGRVGVEPAPVAVPLDDDALVGPGATAELDRSEERIVLQGGLRALSRRERRAILLRYYSDLSQERIASELGVSQAQVSRILATALRKLQDALTAPAGETLCDPAHETTMSGH